MPKIYKIDREELKEKVISTSEMFHWRKSFIPD